MDRVDVLVKIFNDAREGAFTENGFVYKDVNEWIEDNPKLTRFILGYDEDLKQLKIQN